ncbi:MAG TPA: hypothetical protein VLM76_09000 [Patescibacteria group bacterium]|nr:hypothetical protein [Patescibacteria group bacterium]
MTAQRRLARLEGALSPKGATLLWLTEAHGFPTLPAYVGWLLDQPKEAAPLWRVPEQAETAVRAAMRGESREALRQAVRQTVRDAVFLVELVIRLNLAAEEATRFEGLRYAALFWEMRALTAEAELERGTDGAGGRRPIARRAATWRAAVCGWLTDLSAAEEARHLLERRYLDGRGVLFPDLGRNWDTLRETGARLAALADALPALRDGRSRSRGPRNLSPLRTAVGGGAAAEAACLADTARAAALDLLGDQKGAAFIAERPLRSAE